MQGLSSLKLRRGKVPLNAYEGSDETMLTLQKLLSIVQNERGKELKQHILDLYEDDREKVTHALNTIFWHGDTYSTMLIAYISRDEPSVEDIQMLVNDLGANPALWTTPTGKYNDSMDTVNALLLAAQWRKKDIVQFLASKSKGVNLHGKMDVSIQHLEPRVQQSIKAAYHKGIMNHTHRSVRRRSAPQLVHSRRRSQKTRRLSQR